MLKGKIQDYNQHKQWLKDFFNGEFIHPNFLNVDSDNGVGFIFFYKIHPGIYFMVFNIEAKVDIPFTVDYSSSLYFDYIASFFNADIVFEGENNEEIRSNGFYTCTKDTIINSNVKAGQLIKHINIFYSKDTLREIDDVEISEYYLNRSSFFHFFEERNDIKAFKMSLTEIIKYSTILKTKILPVKMQELYYMFLNGIKKVDLSTTAHNHKITEEQLIALFNIRQGILENLNKRPDVGDLVSKSGIDKTLIQQLFHEVFGHTIYNFYMVNRMERVKNILLKGKLSMSEIAEKFGFSHVQHFSSTFKKYFDESPSRYQKLNK